MPIISRPCHAQIQGHLANMWYFPCLTFYYHLHSGKCSLAISRTRPNSSTQCTTTRTLPFPLCPPSLVPCLMLIPSLKNLKGVGSVDSCRHPVYPFCSRTVGSICDQDCCYLPY